MCFVTCAATRSSRPVVVNHDTVTLELGRSTRYATAAQRRALIVRDGGCTFPGPLLTQSSGRSGTGGVGAESRQRSGASTAARPGDRTREAKARSDQTFTWTTPTGRTLHSQRNRGSPTP